MIVRIEEQEVSLEGSSQSRILRLKCRRFFFGACEVEAISDLEALL